jgi:hypothetical protein
VPRDRRCKVGKAKVVGWFGREEGHEGHFSAAMSGRPFVPVLASVIGPTTNGRWLLPSLEAILGMRQEQSDPDEFQIPCFNSNSVLQFKFHASIQIPCFNSNSMLQI